MNKVRPGHGFEQACKLFIAFVAHVEFVHDEKELIN